MNKTFTMWMEDEQREELRRMAYEQDRPMAQIIRESIKCYVEKERKKSLAQKSEPTASE